ncbi:MbtH family NRPS accessory protein [Streptomyces sp. NBC_01102]|uniref:MbtH family protein n=1 Tax=unclassified Streptomyces TaxID=2593676 RepID=UPI00386A5609|nr:MbtH family NRPS accessory protein [Streptomyces sp. NBC_01102]
MSEPEDLCFVVRNNEDQYSLWPTGREVPAGWETVGDRAPRSACLDLIAQRWTDMRPASLRAFMDPGA